METPSTPSPLSSQDERTIAALAHISVLLPLVGVIAPIIIWVTQKERSRFVAFQSLQAIAYQLVMVLVWFLGIGCYIGSFFLTFVPFMVVGGPASSNSPPLFFFIPFAIFFAMLALMGLMVIYGIVAAVLTFQGNDFRYLLIGRWIERYTQRGAAQ
jgi:uncharacterized Tic20 family protein